MKKGQRRNQAGFTFLEILMFMLVVGITLPIIANLIVQKQKIERTQVTEERLKVANEALQTYFARTGRYPCPANMGDSIDTPGFGVEVGYNPGSSSPPNCAIGTDIQAGTINGRLGYPVVTGALPVRTLNLGDEAIADGWNKRLLYTVTLSYTDLTKSTYQREGAIIVRDGQGNSSTEKLGNVIYNVIAFGAENKGAYTLAGVPVEACGTNSDLANENCDYDAEFTNTIQYSEAVNSNAYSSRMSYKSSCINSFTPPDHYSIFLDNSGSMRALADQTRLTDGCPEGMSATQGGYEGGCTRMDVAQWALRRALAARRAQLDVTGIKGTTAFSVFTAADKRNSTPNDVYKELTKDKRTPEEIQAAKDRGDPPLPKGYNIEIDPENLDDDPKNDLSPEESAARFEEKMRNSCPPANTALGVHTLGMLRVMDDMQDYYKTEHRKNAEDVKKEVRVLTLFTDGNNKEGTISQIAAVKKVLREQPMTNIFVIDVGDNTEMKNFIQDNNIPEDQAKRYKYMPTQGEIKPGLTKEEREREMRESHAKLLGFLNETIGLCDPPPAKEFTDSRYCLGEGKWL